MEKVRDRKSVPTTTVVEELQRQLANAFALYVGYKGCHWYVSGPLFYPLHRLFDEHATEILVGIDALGERIRALGGDPVATLPDIHGEATISLESPAESAFGRMLARMVANQRQVIGELRRAVETADQAGDPATTDLLTEVLRRHEKQEWILRETTNRAPDGLLSYDKVRNE